MTQVQIGRTLEILLVVLVIVGLFAGMGTALAQQSDASDTSTEKTVCVNEKSGKTIVLPQESAATVEDKNKNINCLSKGPSPQPTP